MYKGKEGGMVRWRKGQSETGRYGGIINVKGKDWMERGKEERKKGNGEIF